MENSLDWFKGKFTGNPWVFTIKLIGLSCKFSHNPILGRIHEYSIAHFWSPKCSKVHFLWRLIGWTLVQCESPASPATPPVFRSRLSVASMIKSWGDFPISMFFRTPFWVSHGIPWNIPLTKLNSPCETPKIYHKTSHTLWIGFFRYDHSYSKVRSQKTRPETARIFCVGLASAGSAWEPMEPGVA